MQLQLVIQEREVQISSKAPCIHLIETAPSIIRKMPGVVLKNHTVKELRRIWWGEGVSAGILSLEGKHKGDLGLCACSLKMFGILFSPRLFLMQSDT